MGVSHTVQTQQIIIIMTLNVNIKGIPYFLKNISGVLARRKAYIYD